MPAPTCKRGRQQSFSDEAIQTCLTLKVLFGLPLAAVCCVTNELTHCELFRLSLQPRNWIGMKASADNMGGLQTFAALARWECVNSES
jgi:hypothetical protein